MESFSFPSQKEVIYLPDTIIKVENVTTANDGYPLIYVREVVANGKNMETDSVRNVESFSGTVDERPGGNAAGKGNDVAGIYEYGGIQGDGGTVGTSEIFTAEPQTPSKGNKQVEETDVLPDVSENSYSNMSDDEITALISELNSKGARSFHEDRFLQNIILFFDKKWNIDSVPNDSKSLRCTSKTLRITMFLIQYTTV